MIRLCQSWCQKYQGVFTIYVYSANIFFVAKIQITYDNTMAYEKRKVLSRTPDGQSGSFLRKQCVNKRFQLGEFSELHMTQQNS